MVQKVYTPKESEEYEQYSMNRMGIWTYLFISIVLAAASMLSKETGITVVGVCLLYDFVYSSASSKVSDVVLSIFVLISGTMRDECS